MTCHRILGSYNSKVHKAQNNLYNNTLMCFDVYQYGQEDNKKSTQYFQFIRGVHINQTNIWDSF